MPQWSEDRWLWLCVGIAIFIGVRNVSNGLKEVVELTTVTKDETAPTRAFRIGRDTEDALKLSTLRTLTQSPNYEIRQSAYKILATRASYEPSIPTLINTDLSSSDPAARRRGQLVSRFISEHRSHQQGIPKSGGRDFSLPRTRTRSPSPSPLGEPWSLPTTTTSDGSHGDGVGAPELYDLREMLYGAGGPLGSNPSDPAAHARRRHIIGEGSSVEEQERRRRRREAMVLREGDVEGPVGREDIFSPVRLQRDDQQQQRSSGGGIHGAEIGNGDVDGAVTGREEVEAEEVLDVARQLTALMSEFGLADERAARVRLARRRRVVFDGGA